MQQKNKPENIFEDMQGALKEMMGTIPSSSFDIQAVMETGRKNFQAITEANKRAMQGWQNLAQRQSEMVSEFLQNNSHLSGGTFIEGSTADKIISQSEAIKLVYQRSIENTRELATLAGQCTKDAADVITQRVVASVNEIRSATSAKDNE